MCKFNTSQVVNFVHSINATDLRLEEVLPAMEDRGVVDAAVVLMARDGRIKEAMKRLIDHLQTLESTMVGLLDSTNDQLGQASKQEAADELLDALQKFINIGIWLCQGQNKTSLKRAGPPQDRKSSTSKGELNPEELLWLDFIDATVQISKAVSASIANIDQLESNELDYGKMTADVRTLVQRSFTALLVSTSTPSASGTGLSFLRILRAFLTRASLSSPNLSDLRAVLSSIFSAYAYEESILSLANRLLDKDLFVNVKLATELRQRGWRPRGSYCEGCRRRVWGPGAVGDVFGKWEEKQAQDWMKREARMQTLRGGDHERGKGRAKMETDTKARDVDPVTGKGKGKGSGPGRVSITDTDEDDEDQDPADAEKGREQDLGPLVVMACRHIYHQSCLEAIQVDDAFEEGVGEGREFRCPIDG